MLTERQGRGRWINDENMMYEGEYSDDNRHGHGFCVQPDGGKYIGGWENGLIHGKGEWIFQDGTKRSGTFKDWKEDGISIQTDADGNEEQ